MGLPVLRQSPVIIQIFRLSLFGLSPVKGRHGDIYVPLGYELRHEAEEKSQQQGRYMGSVHVGIGHYYYLVIAELRDIEIIAVALGKTAAEGIYHCLYLSIGQNLIYGGLLHIQYLTSYRKDGLIHTVPCSLCRASRRVSLDYEDLALGSIP